MHKAVTVPLGQATVIRRQSAVGWRTCGGVAISALVQQQARRAIFNCAVQYTNDDIDKGANKRPETTTNTAERAMAQSQSPLGRVGVAAALAAKGGGEKPKPKPTLWDEFALRDRVALVSGANRGLGLEMALVLIEAGARAVYCVDLPATPGEEWRAVAEYVARMEVEGAGGGGRLEYVCADVRDQKVMWKVGEEIGDREGRMDICVAAAGIGPKRAHTDCLEYRAEEFEEVRILCSSFPLQGPRERWIRVEVFLD